MNDHPHEKELIPRQTLPVMASAYREAVAAMKAALVSLSDAQQRLQFVFGSGDRYSSAFDFTEVWRRAHSDLPPADGLELHWRQAAWRILVDRMELKRICSVKRAQEIDKQLEEPKSLPDITESNMIAMLEGNAQNVGDFLQEAITECFDQLRPWRRGDLGDGLKTNHVYEIGERVILHYAVSQSYGGGRFRMSYSGSKTQLVRCLDNVMHLLDGKGTVPTHAGPLVDAINGEGNHGHVETDYFEAKSFKNQNLHLRFKRLDLLAELNRRGAGTGNQLPGQRSAKGGPA